MKPHKCPVCSGQGLVSRPPWIPGDVREWNVKTTELYSCQVCTGGLVWSDDATERRIKGCLRLIVDAYHATAGSDDKTLLQVAITAAESLLSEDT